MSFLRLLFSIYSALKECNAVIVQFMMVYEWWLKEHHCGSQFYFIFLILFSPHPCWSCMRDICDIIRNVVPYTTFLCVRVCFFLKWHIYVYCLSILFHGWIVIVLFCSWILLFLCRMILFKQAYKSIHYYTSFIIRNWNWREWKFKQFFLYVWKKRLKWLKGFRT